MVLQSQQNYSFLSFPCCLDIVPAISRSLLVWCSPLENANLQRMMYTVSYWNQQQKGNPLTFTPYNYCHICFSLLPATWTELEFLSLFFFFPLHMVDFAISYMTAIYFGHIHYIVSPLTFINPLPFPNLVSLLLLWLLCVRPVSFIRVTQMSVDKASFTAVHLPSQWLYH